jgi:hypothetical protein
MTTQLTINQSDYVNDIIESFKKIKVATFNYELIENLFIKKDMKEIDNMINRTVLTMPESVIEVFSDYLLNELFKRITLDFEIKNDYFTHLTTIYSELQKFIYSESYNSSIIYETAKPMIQTINDNVMWDIDNSMYNDVSNNLKHLLNIMNNISIRLYNFYIHCQTYNTFHNYQEKTKRTFLILLHNYSQIVFYILMNI